MAEDYLGGDDMGGKSSPDYEGAARIQGEMNEAVNRDQTYANRPTQFTPYGTINWDSYAAVDPATGEPVTRWEQRTELTPELQDILNRQIAIQGGRTDVAGMLTGRMQNEFGAPVDWSNLQPMRGVPTEQFTLPEGGLNDPNSSRSMASRAVYDQAMSRIQPQFDSKRNQLEIKLRNQGIGPGDELWDAQFGQLAQQENDAVNQAVWSAVGEGRTESGQMFDQAYRSNQANFGQAMDASEYSAAIRQQQITEELTQRGYSLNEINALLSGQQVSTPQMPSFVSASRAEAAPVYQAAVDQGNFTQGQRQQTIDAITGVAGGFI